MQEDNTDCLQLRIQMKVEPESENECIADENITFEAICVKEDIQKKVEDNTDHLQLSMQMKVEPETENECTAGENITFEAICVKNEIKSKVEDMTVKVLDVPEIVDIKQSWYHNEVLYLIRLWKDYEGQLKSRSIKKPIFAIIANKLKEIGCDKSPDQVCKKIQNLKDIYRRNKPKTTGDKPPTWVFYHQVHEVIGYKPFYNAQKSTAKEVGYPVKLEAEIVGCSDERSPTIKRRKLRETNKMLGRHLEIAEELLQEFKEDRKVMMSFSDCLSQEFKVTNTLLEQNLSNNK